MATLEDVLVTIDANSQAALDRLFALVRIPSISAQPAHYPDCDRAADWLAAQLAELGFEAKKEPTEGRPMVLGAQGQDPRRAACAVLRPLRRAAGRPAGALEKPAVRAQAGRRRGRRAHRRARRSRRQGPTDDLSGGVPRLPGQWRAAVPCHRAARGRGGDRLAVAARVPDRHAKALKADLLLVCDTNMWNAERPLSPPCCAGWCSRRSS